MDDGKSVEIVSAYKEPDSQEIYRIDEGNLAYRCVGSSTTSAKGAVQAPGPTQGESSRERTRAWRKPGELPSASTKRPFPDRVTMATRKIRTKMTVETDHPRERSGRPGYQQEPSKQHCNGMAASSKSTVDLEVCQCFRSNKCLPTMDMHQTQAIWRSECYDFLRRGLATACTFRLEQGCL